MSQPVFMLSPVGTSVLTNRRPGLDDRRWSPPQGTSTAGESELSAEDRRLIDQRAEDVRAYLEDASGRMTYSAELHGIFRYHELPECQRTPRDEHWLLPSDTYLGRAAADVVATVLRAEGFNVRVLDSFDGLNTRSTAEFRNGVVSLARWVSETLPAYTEQGFRIAFNVTGGFKTLVAYLNVLGMVHRAEMIYVFESQQEAVRIPALPLKMDAEVYPRFATVFGRMERGEGVSEAEVAGIPETLLFEVEPGVFMMSEIGEIGWGASKKDIYGERLLAWPRLESRGPFDDAFAGYKDKNLRAKFQDALAEFSAVLTATGNPSLLRNRGSYKYDKMASVKVAEFGEVYHFRPTEGYRIICAWSGENLVLLDLMTKNDFKSKYGGG